MDPETRSLLEALSDRLSARQRDHALRTVDAFESIGTPTADRLLRRWLISALSSPDRVGCAPLDRLCGCDSGFLLVSDRRGPAETVERCPRCFSPPPVDLPRSIYAD